MSNPYQKSNEIIAVFCGGILEHSIILGDVFRFNNEPPPSYLMKYPPRPNGLVSIKSLRYDFDYNWLFVAIKKCGEKQTTIELKELYNEIINSLAYFDIHEPIGYTYNRVFEFITLYNKTQS